MVVDTDYAVLYLFAELLCLFLVLGMAGRMNSNVGAVDEVKVFRRLSLCSAVQMASECLWMLSESFLPGMPRSIRYIACLLDLVATGYIVCFWLLFVDLKVTSRQHLARRKKAVLVLQILPVAILSAMDISTLWNHRVFYLAQDGTYVRGTWYPLHAAFCFFYFVPALFLLAKGWIRKTAEAEELCLYLLFSCLLVAGGILQLFTDAVPFTAFFFTMGMFLIFSSLQSRQICTDALTGLNNRARSNGWVRSHLAHARREPFYLFMADIDGFKGINDRYGHIMGDEALAVVAQTLGKLSEEYHTLFASRYGGDEFLLTVSGREADPEKLIERFSDLLEEDLDASNLPFRFSVSIGYAAAVRDDMTAKELVGKADEALYGRKRAMYGIPEPFGKRRTPRPRSETLPKDEASHPIRKKETKNSSDNTA